MTIQETDKPSNILDLYMRLTLRCKFANFDLDSAFFLAATLYKDRFSKIFVHSSSELAFR